MSKPHTPGPWRLNGRHIFTKADNPILGLHAPTAEGRMAFHANAQIIQAAPDMRAVLLSLRDVYSEHLAALPEGLRGAILAAIAKGDCT